MGFYRKPLNTKDIQAYHFVRQFYHRLCEVNCAVNADYLWPRGNNRYDTGEIVAADLDQSSSDPDDWTITFTIENSDGTPKEYESTYPTGCTGTSRWVDLDCPGPAPATYDLVIEGGHTTRTITVDGDDYTIRIPDETMIVRGRIVESTDDTVTVKALSIINAVTGKIIPSVASLEDKRCHIMRSRLVGQSLHPMERWVAWPNGYPTQAEIAAGTGARTFTINGESVSVLGRMVLWTGSVESGDDRGFFDTTDNLTGKNSTTFDPTAPQRWVVDRWKDQEVLVYDTLGVLHRETIVGNTRWEILYGVQGEPGHVSEWTPTGDYLVVEVGCRAIPDRKPEAAKAWYGGYSTAVYGHYPDDTTFDIPWPEASITYSEGATEFDCEPTSHDAFDVDIYIQPDDVCSEFGPDYLVAPDLLKGRRGLQNAVLAFIPQFIDDNTVGVGKAGASWFTTATAFRRRGINSTIATITAVSGGVVTHSGATLPKPTPSSPTPSSLGVHWAVIDHDRERYKSGADGVLTSTQIGGTDIGADDVGKTLVIFYGFTAPYPREFFRFYPQTIFIPDNDTSEGGAGIIDPARVINLAVDGCFGVGGVVSGGWIRRDPSTTYLERDGLGFSVEGSQGFIANELARYVGSHLFTPDVGISQPGTERVISGNPDNLVPYWDRFTIGAHWTTGREHAIRAAMFGVATDGGSNFLTDASKNWYRSVWYVAGADVMRVESGAATADGTTTSLFCSAKTSGTTDPAHCFYESGRFVGFGAYEGFPIRIRQTRGAVVTEYRSVITSVSQTGGGTTYNFRAIPSAVQETDEFFIDEPYELNRWESRIVEITKATTGVVINAVVKWSDIDTLFFDDLPSGAVVEAGDKWRLIEIPVGSVLKFVELGGGATGWVRPIVGTNDPRKGDYNAAGVAGGTYKDSPWNLPTTVRGYRAAMVGDYSGIQWVEMYEVLNLLYLRRQLGDWTGRGECNVAAWSGDTEAPILARPLPEECDSLLDICHESYPHGPPTAPYCDNADGYRAAFMQALGSYEGCPDLDTTTNDPPHLNLFASRISVDTCDDGIGADADTNYSYYDGQVIQCQKAPIGVQLWILGEGPDCTETTFVHCAFQNNGAPIADGTWTNWDNSTTDEDGFWLSAKFGDLWSDVTRPEPPPEPATGHQYRAGFRVADAFALVDHSPFMELRDP